MLAVIKLGKHDFMKSGKIPLDKMSLANPKKGGNLCLLHLEEFVIF